MSTDDVIPETNLIELDKYIGRNARGVLTTFEFDLHFFENYFLKQVRERVKELIVLVEDSKIKLPSHFVSKSLGKYYHVKPVVATSSGVFHPKVFMFISENNVLGVVGSHNLTSPGFFSNAELTSKIEVSKEKGGEKELLISILEFLKELKKRGFCYDKRLDTVLSLPEWFEGVENVKMGRIFVHNLDKPIIEQFKEIVDNDAIETVYIMSPFFGGEDKLLDYVSQEINPKSIHLFIQEKNNTLDVEKVKKWISKNDSIKLVISEINFKEPRRLHGKLILAKGASTSYLLTGSANFTTSALLSNAKIGNIECCILQKGGVDRFDYLIDYLNQEEILDLDKIKSIKPEEKIEYHKKLKLLSTDIEGEKIRVNMGGKEELSSPQLVFVGVPLKSIDLNQTTLTATVTDELWRLLTSQPCEVLVRDGELESNKALLSKPATPIFSERLSEEDNQRINRIIENNGVGISDLTKNLTEDLEMNILKLEIVFKNLLGEQPTREVRRISRRKHALKRYLRGIGETTPSIRVPVLPTDISKTKRPATTKSFEEGAGKQVQRTEGVKYNIYERITDWFGGVLGILAHERPLRDQLLLTQLVELNKTLVHYFFVLKNPAPLLLKGIRINSSILKEYKNAVIEEQTRELSEEELQELDADKRLEYQLNQAKILPWIYILYLLAYTPQKNILRSVRKEYEEALNSIIGDKTHFFEETLSKIQEFDIASIGVVEELNITKAQKKELSNIIQNDYDRKREFFWALFYFLVDSISEDTWREVLDTAYTQTIAKEDMTEERFLPYILFVDYLNEGIRQGTPKASKLRSLLKQIRVSSEATSKESQTGWRSRNLRDIMDKTAIN